MSFSRFKQKLNGLLKSKVSRAVITMEPPQEFPFPFPAYNIQKQFMRELYNCLEGGKLGLFESPTGTGKSLSLICGALKWLVDHEKCKKEELTSAIAEIDGKIENYEKPTDDWFSVQTEQIQLNREKQTFQAKLNAILEFEGEKGKFKRIIESNKVAKTKATQKVRQQFRNSQKKTTDQDKTEDVDSDVHDTEKDLILEDPLSSSESSEEEDKEEPLFKNTKIFFCSRTHSQLTQFVHELQRSPYSQDISVVPLSSRYFC